MKKAAVLVLALTGLIFIVLSSPDVIKSLRLRFAGIKTEGRVTSVVQTSRKSELDRVTVEFSTSEPRQVTATGMKRGYVSTGDRVTLWYDSANPEVISFGDSAAYNMRAVVMGLLIFVFGMYFFIKYVAADISGKKLVASGMKVAAEVKIERDERFRAGDNNPWLIRGIWTDNRTGKEYSYSSKLYTIDPAPYLNGRSHVDVYVNPDDPSKYHMDTSFMPKGNNTIG